MVVGLHLSPGLGVRNGSVQHGRLPMISSHTTVQYALSPTPRVPCVAVGSNRGRGKGKSQGPETIVDIDERCVLLF